MTKLPIVEAIAIFVTWGKGPASLRLGLLFTIMLALSACAVGPASVVGAYKFTDGSREGVLDLRPDHGFTEVVRRHGGRRSELKGTWELSHGDLVRQPCMVVERNGGERKSELCSQPIHRTLRGISIIAHPDYGPYYYKER